MTFAEASVTSVAIVERAGSPSSEIDRRLVRLQGEYDLSTHRELSMTLAQVMAQDTGDVVLDLRAVTFMDVSTVSIILLARDTLRDRKRQLALRSPSRCARRIIELCGVADMIDSRDTGEPDGHHPLQPAPPAASHAQ
jgi:anti-anti-sigma factor